jgi:hypothetical protein
MGQLPALPDFPTAALALVARLKIAGWEFAENRRKG